MADDAGVARCAQLGTVASTVASASYANAMMELAESAKTAGFACLAVQPYDDFHALHAKPELIVPLPLPPQPLLPRQIWCSESGLAGARNPSGMKVGIGWYGWRRSHLYRVLMWVNILSRGYHLLAIDLDWRFVAGSWMHEIMRLTSQDGSPMDVLNWWDGPKERTVNVGLMWIRSSPSALALARHVQNRTFAAWEQGLFTEELQFRYTRLSCCHCNTLMNTWFNRSWKDHKGKVTAQTSSAAKRREASSLMAARIELEGHPRCTEHELPPGDFPPNMSRWNWNTSGWLPHSYNWIARRYYGRCTGSSDCTCAYEATSEAAIGKQQTPRDAPHFKRIVARGGSISAFKAEVSSST